MNAIYRRAVSGLTGPAILLFLLLTLIGAIGYRGMKIQQFPDIDLPTVSIIAALPGASPAQMETDVARKLEDSIATLQGVKHIYTMVQSGTVTVTVEFRLEVPYRVVINEAVELAKTFGAEHGHKYVNAVLDKVALKLRAAEVRNKVS